MSSQLFKVIPLAAAISAAVFSITTFAEEQSAVSEVAAKPTDVLTDGWNVNGYVRAGYRLTNKGVSTGQEFNKGDYRTAGTTGKNANQVEFTLTKKTTFQNGVWSDLVVRSEYGNGDSLMHSSSGSEEGANADGGFEVKEAFVKLGGFSYLPEDASIWAGRRFLNRSAGLLSGEFWKQSSGVGFGYEQGRSGVALVSADPNEAQGGTRYTTSSLDFYSYGHEGLGGSFDFDLKLMGQGNKSKLRDDDADAATHGVGLAVTYNRDWYGFDGWSQTAVAYGAGMAGNRGVNFGKWTKGAATNKDGKTLLLTTYGVVNIDSNLQVGTEVTYLTGKNIWGLKGDQKVERLLVAARPSYKVNDNFRVETTFAYGPEKSEWTGNKKQDAYTAELAGVFTVNADYFGRPQIKPFVTYLYKDVKDGWGDEFENKKGVYQFGVEAEIWF